MARYSSLKDSGVEWIGEIPSHWEKVSLGKIGILYGGLTGKSGDDFRSDNHPLNKSFIPFTNISNNTYISKTHFQYVVIGDNENQNRVEKFDLFFLMSSEDYGDLGKSSILIEDVGELYLNSFCKGFRVKRDDVFPLFLNYQLLGDTHKKLISIEGNGFTRINLRQDRLKETPIFIPPLSEQQQIVSYLDTKTSLIDSLIEKTQRKIELLKEKRTSLINEVVTKGLNPNVEMKDSGVEGIGEIPRGWGVKRLKNVSDVKPSNVDKHIFPDEIQVRLCNYTDVYYNDFISESTELKPGSCNQMEFEKFRLKKGDVIITKDSESPDDIGIPCLVKDDFDDVVCGYHLTLIRPQTMDGGFIFRFIQSDRTRRYFEIHSNGITRYGLGKSSIENLSLPFPPISEQNEIVSYLDEHTQLIDKTISIEEKRIELLKEYRQSLISEVVTGKIDVRVN